MIENGEKRIFLTGWKDIAQAMGLKSERTARKWANTYHMPVVYINKKPTVIISVFERWWVNLHDRLSKKKKSVAD